MTYNEITYPYFVLICTRVIATTLLHFRVFANTSIIIWTHCCMSKTIARVQPGTGTTKPINCSIFSIIFHNSFDARDNQYGIINKNGTAVGTLQRLGRYRWQGFILMYYLNEPTLMLNRREIFFNLSLLVFLFIIY